MPLGILLPGFPVQDVKQVADREQKIDLEINLHVVHACLAITARLDHPFVAGLDGLLDKPAVTIAVQQVTQTELDLGIDLFNGHLFHLPIEDFMEGGGFGQVLAGPKRVVDKLCSVDILVCFAQSSEQGLDDLVRGDADD